MCASESFIGSESKRASEIISGYESSEASDCSSGYDVHAAFHQKEFKK